MEDYDGFRVIGFLREGMMMMVGLEYSGFRVLGFLGDHDDDGDDGFRIF